MKEVQPNPWLAAWDAVVSGEEDGRALGLLRIAIVGVLTLSYASHLGSVGEYFSDEGILWGRYAKLAYPARESIYWWVTEPGTVRAIWGLGLLAQIAWTVGLFTRVSAVLGVVAWASMYGRQPLLYAYPDQLGLVLLFLLALMPTGNALSLDARRRGPRPVPTWCRTLIQFQIAVVYVATGLMKTGVTWKEGTALYFTLVNPYNRHIAWGSEIAVLQPWLLRPATWLARIWELGFGAFVLVHWLRSAAKGAGAPRKLLRWLPELRPIFLGFGCLMHASLALLLYVVWFSPLMIASYLAWLSPQEATRWLARLGVHAREPGESPRQGQGSAS